MAKLVNFLIAGTQKGGTSALDAYLRVHPEVRMAKEKEVHFFDNEDLFSAGEPDYSIYHSSFSGEPFEGELKFGEATPIYMYWRDAPERIAKYNPQMQLIILLRNPIERAYSHWNMERARAADDVPFDRAIREEERRVAPAKPLQHRVFSYVDRGYYTEQLQRIWQFFSRSQTLVLKTESLQSDPDATLNHVCRFLDIAAMPVVGRKRVFAGEYHSEMSRSSWVYLCDVFESEIRKLEELLGWDCRHWRRDVQSSC